MFNLFNMFKHKKTNEMTGVGGIAGFNGPKPIKEQDVDHSVFSDFQKKLIKLGISSQETKRLVMLFEHITNNVSKNKNFSQVEYDKLISACDRIQKTQFGKIDEESYEGNMAFTELMRFYQIATEKQIHLLELLLKKEKLKTAIALVEKVVGVQLVKPWK